LLKCKFWIVNVYFWEEIVIRNVDDVRIALKEFKEMMIENFHKGVQEPHMHLKLR